MGEMCQFKKLSIYQNFKDILRLLNPPIFDSLYFIFKNFAINFLILTSCLKIYHIFHSLAPPGQKNFQKKGGETMQNQIFIKF